ncbi:FMN-dependent NADH-azoreductase [Vallitalea okinawensis]|uniref:FMN-dependent NADH-azoreductase n=1 Tax=Vallitalea okinawensis TaxID=2078660 RepID=UPI000CFCE708|nr:FMN-dependent NADH-azoreductase [Vallitalea okinawensis]
MNKVLYITANPKSEEQSFSLAAGRELIELYKQNNPNDEVTEIDVYDIDIPYIDAEVFNGWGKLQSGKGFEELTETERSKISQINVFTEQFIEADKYVFVTPMWNFSVPPLMKAYIDTISIAGKTFKYTDSGPVGLLVNKKAIHIQASGGIYSEGPAKPLEHGNNFIKAILGLFGVVDVQSVLIEGTNFPEPGTDAIKAKTSERIKEVLHQF